MPYAYMENDKLKLLYPIPRDQLEKRYGSLTDEQHDELTRWHLDKSIELVWIDQKDVPTDRTYRNAWELVDGIATNLQKKAVIDETILRNEQRKLALEELIQEKVNDRNRNPNL